MDHKQAQLVEQYQESYINKEEQDEDELFEALDNDESVMSQYREARIQQLAKEFKRIDESGVGDVTGGHITDITDEKSLMNVVKQAEVCVVHFYQPHFEKCRKMTDKLSILARKHLPVKVLSIKAELAPFLVTKLKIKALPFVAMYYKGNEVDRLVGFEKLGNNPEDFEYSALESVLLKHGLINRRALTNTAPMVTIKNNDDDSDLDI